MPGLEHDHFMELLYNLEKVYVEASIRAVREGAPPPAPLPILPSPWENRDRSPRPRFPLGKCKPPGRVPTTTSTTASTRAPTTTSTSTMTTASTQELIDSESRHWVWVEELIVDCEESLWVFEPQG